MAGTEELPALIETAEDLMHVVIEDVHWLLVRVSKEKTEAEIKKRHSEYGEHVRMLKGVMERINEVVVRGKRGFFFHRRIPNHSLKEGKEFQSGSIETDEIRALRERKETLRQVSHHQIIAIIN